MPNAKYDVVGIGNAIVDVLAHAEDSFLKSHGLVKGTMSLINSQAADKLYEEIEPTLECSGGSAANSIAALAVLGGRGAFIGKVCDDKLGAIFRKDIAALGIVFNSTPSRYSASTARCLILVTPDAQRTMQTYLGACVELGPDDIDENLIADSHITYLEGYLWDPPKAKEAFVKAAVVARKAGRKVALSLSDPLCVARHRDDFIDLVDNHVDILFANEAEITSLYQVSNFDAALQKVRGHCEIAALTRSAKGAVLISGDEVHVLDAEPLEKVVDTTGAGDAYAAGFFYGLVNGKSIYDCGRIGAIAAAEVIGHFGARPEVSLAKLVAKKLG
ncbi:MAG: carbohydrate kinase [Rhodospirillales bacterium RIFCSPLOWO2_12_FULL_58_28]|nr:MAG: carbohydrate kinase [Rhodospirillales bacterium RIFCSPLOWO2_02_FULL_58_16]OHC77635.1 MAG: carbohydrate kinase [Rhodospirillales bacterium RIFCSPLOWO2_12_FULL_58_28]